MADPIPDEGKLRAIADFMARLKLTSVALLLLFLVGCVMVWALYQTSAQWAPHLWQSQSLLLSLVVGAALIAIGALLSSQQRRGDARVDALYAQVREQIDRERAERAAELARERADRATELARERAERQAERTAMQTEITDLKARDRECQNLIRRMSIQLAEIKRKTGFGDLSEGG